MQINITHKAWLKDISLKDARRQVYSHLANLWWSSERNILSACSSVFKEILKINTNNNHPVIYLRGIQYSEMESILQFVYLGEAKCYKERMNEFLTVAKNLHILELANSIEDHPPSTIRHPYMTFEWPSWVHPLPFPFPELHNRGTTDWNRLQGRFKRTGYWWSCPTKN